MTEFLDHASYIAAAPETTDYRARDTIADADYFTAKIKEELNYLEMDRQDLPGLIEEKGPDAAALARNISDVQTICASMAYSRGDSIEKVREWIIGALDDLKYVQSLYEKHPNQLRKAYDSFWDRLLCLSYAILYAPGPGPTESVIKDTEFFQKTDPIIVAMLSAVKGEPINRHRDDSELDFPKQFAQLWHAISYPGDAGIAPLRRYLDVWYDTNRPLRGEGAPGIGAHEKMIRYQGYWCWEAAAVAVMMDIDDSSFRDHPHYPKDLVDWARQQKAAGRT